MSRSLKLLACALASVALLAVAAACGDSGGSSPNPTATLERPATSTTPGATSTTPAQSTPIATAAGVPNESGEAPIFYRTADDFASVVAGQQYKMLLRITNGYAEPTITVDAVCTTCRSPNETPTATLSGFNVTPVGEDAPGSYYPVDVRLPRAGHWELTVQAGADQVTIPVDAKAAP